MMWLFFSSSTQLPTNARKTMKSFTPKGIPVAGDTSNPELIHLSDEETSQASTSTGFSHSTSNTCTPMKKQMKSEPALDAHSSSQPLLEFSAGEAISTPGSNNQHSAGRSCGGWVYKSTKKIRQEIWRAERRRQKFVRVDKVSSGEISGPLRLIQGNPWPFIKEILDRFSNLGQNQADECLIASKTEYICEARRGVESRIEN